MRPRNCAASGVASTRRSSSGARITTSTARPCACATSARVARCAASAAKSIARRAAPPAPGRVEIEGVAETLPRPGRQSLRAADGVSNGDHEVDREPVLVRLVWTEGTAPRPPRLTVYPTHVGLGDREPGVRVEQRRTYRGVD